MAHSSRLTAHASRLMAHGQKKFGARARLEPRALSHEPLTINNRLTDELFDFSLQALGIIQELLMHSSTGLKHKIISALKHRIQCSEDLRKKLASHYRSLCRKAPSIAYFMCISSLLLPPSGLDENPAGTTRIQKSMFLSFLPKSNIARTFVLVRYCLVQFYTSSPF